jgi:hypothetical protein
MHARVMKWLSVAALPLTVLFWKSALTFNPLLPVFQPAGNTALFIVLFSIGSFLMALVELRPLPFVPNTVYHGPESGESATISFFRLRRSHRG